MTTPLLILLAAGVVLAVALLRLRRHDRDRQRVALADRSATAEVGPAAGPVLLPQVDLARCLGCGTCVRACPEEGVLALVHGQATVVNGALCVGHARCAAECPVGAIELAPASAAARADVPAVTPELEAVGVPGLFLVGEVTARALIRTATEHGAAAARAIAAHRSDPDADPDVLDAILVGAGPGGLAAALGCREAELRIAWIDQEHEVGGTVARYPRRKLVLTEPLRLPIHGSLPAREYRKEELITLWQELCSRHALPFRGGVRLDALRRGDDGVFTVATSDGTLRARHVVLAIGRRGVPRRLGVPGEDLPHVANSLLDAASYHDAAIAVVGGGDSAVEAALALAEQPGNTVTLIHRRGAFARVRAKNRDRLAAARAAGHLAVRLDTGVAAIREGSIDLRTGAGDGPVESLRADHVFVAIGGTAPSALLTAAGVQAGGTPSPADSASVRRSFAPVAAVVFAGGAVAFAALHWSYYGATAAERAADPMHARLRPDQAVGLWLGVAAIAAVFGNLAYLLRRRRAAGMRFGTLTAWMDAHILTGALAIALAALHAGLAPRATPGGHALWVLAALGITGAIGRWFYAWLPRAANGRELALAAVRADLAHALAAADAAAVEGLLERRQWRATLPGRVVTLLGLQWDLWRTLRRLRRDGIPVTALADVRRAHRLAVAAAHLEDLRTLLATWRWLHRWGALLLLLLVAAHVFLAWAHGAFAGGAG